MMVAVLQARFEAENYNPHDVGNADRGSDCDSECHEDCTDFAFVQDSHVLHNDDVVVDGVHSVAHDAPVDFVFLYRSR